MGRQTKVTPEELIKFRGLDKSEGKRLCGYVRRDAELDEQRRLASDSHPPDWLNWKALLYKYGKTMGGLPLNPADVQYLNRIALEIHRRGGWRSFLIQECYHNCRLLRSYDDEDRLSYCEGYADNGHSPFLHAWVTINGSVTDPTLDATERGDAPDPYRAYFGIEIPLRQITDLDKYKPPIVQYRRFWEALNIRA